MKGYTIVISLETSENDDEKVLFERTAETHEEAKEIAIKELQNLAEKKSGKSSGENLFCSYDKDGIYFASIWED